jgi:hypothetical protein
MESLIVGLFGLLVLGTWLIYRLVAVLQVQK